MMDSFKNILQEGVNPIVYHFCPLSTMVQIADDDAFKLANTDESQYRSDERMNSFRTGQKDENGNPMFKKYPYYLCFSRTPSTLVGYQLMRIYGTKNEWYNSLVRIEIDGTRLNMNYKGAPVNFFIENDPYDESALGRKYKMVRGNLIYSIPKQGEKKIKSYEMPQVNLPSWKRGKTPIGKNGYPLARVDYESIKRSRMSEYEDRVFSYKPFIENASRYIKRIDIFVTNASLKKPEVISSLLKIIQVYGDNRVYVYNNKVAFNSVNIRDAVNGNRLEKLYGTAFSTKKFAKDNADFGMDVSYQITDADLNWVISAYISMIAFSPNFNENSFKDMVEFICHEVGLDNWKVRDGVIDYTDYLINKSLIFVKDKFPKMFEKRFSIITSLRTRFVLRNGGKKQVMEMFNKLQKLSDLYCVSYSKQHGYSKPKGLGTVAYEKYKEYMMRNNDNK